MRLKQIKLAGFKSFVDATTVPFPDQMTAIVGPNGCGKSNVIDAVRWVLGESSAKNLRGDAMTDVIFNGSTNRKPVSQASVELVFDNAAGRLEGSLASRNEISVKRQVSKDGQSSYFLNGSKCRRRDITDIFLGTGLGPRSYAIIEQGMISRLIESKPQDLRIFIEEAAGISKYKERRRETETRIKHTRDNLERLQDVRDELGTQIEKLKRQAASAKRYKELKAQERQYKAELYALKWHKYNEQLALYERERQQKEAELESFVAEQRGGELGLLKLKEQQQDLTDQQQTAQQAFYQIGSQITRLEQQILFDQEKRHHQAEQNTSLQHQLAEADEYLMFEQDRCEQLAEQLEALMPEREVVEQQVLESESALDEVEQGFALWQERWQAAQQDIALANQSGQVIATKIQSLHDAILRLKQRIADVEQELQESNDAEQSVQLETCQLELQQAIESKTEVEQTLEELRQQRAILKTTQGEILRRVTDLKQQTAQNSYELDRLERWYESYNRFQQDSNSHPVKVEGRLFTQMHVADTWQKSVQTVLSQFSDTWVVEQLPTGLVVGNYLVAGQDAPQANSLASMVLAGSYPAELNNIALATDFEHAKALLNSKHWTSAITSDGVWLGRNWQITLTAQAEQVDVLEQLAMREQAIAKQTELLTEQQAAEQQEQTLANQLANLEHKIDETVAAQQKWQTACSQYQVKIELFEQQVRSSKARAERLKAEQQQLQSQITLDSETIEALQLEAEMAQERQFEQADKLTELESAKSQWQERREQVRAAANRHKEQLHSLALQVQNIEAQHRASVDTLQRGNQQKQQIMLQLQQLQESMRVGGDDGEGDKLALEQLLEQRMDAEQTLIDAQNALAEVKEQIAMLEQGQSGVLTKLDDMKSKIEAIKLDSEGARIRAQNMLDVLNEMSQPLKPVLENMPEEAEETAWSSQLEKTTQAISRLGAINLAAIEEYDIQSQRKAYLDKQAEDLNEALQTLENAIRKIDRESRAKFKETYDKVNSGLQELFPKVFGGGSAYLDLTDDDLLETGVTIMARPPGKKNSTIHLLSGGEKALTALSLVFSIFRLNPAPFCMLDEVDAPLDDANVGRFCKLVQEMSDTVQFIYISHNKVAMEMATHLTGVTMQEPGVSRLVAVDIQEAVKMAEAS